MGRGGRGNSKNNNTVKTETRSVSAKTKVELTLEEKVLANDTDTMPRSFTAGYFEGVDGTIIPGLNYQCDYKAEEEWGIGKLKNAITSEDPRRFQMTEEAQKNIIVFPDRNAIAIFTRPLNTEGEEVHWGMPLNGVTKDYASWVTGSTSRIQRAKGAPYSLNSVTVKELKEHAKNLDLPKPWPTKKEALYSAVMASPNWEKESPNLFAGEFNYGETMVLAADDAEGVTQETMKKLRDAVEAGTLGIGSGSGPFSSGLFFYDTRDETPAIREKREHDFDVYDAHMEKLKPVADKIKEAGWNPYFLGRPNEKTDPETGETVVRYWLNGDTRNKITGKSVKQPFGWYTLEQLENFEWLPEDAR